MLCAAIREQRRGRVHAQAPGQPPARGPARPVLVVHLVVRGAQRVAPAQAYGERPAPPRRATARAPLRLGVRPRAGDARARRTQGAVRAAPIPEGAL